MNGLPVPGNAWCSRAALGVATRQGPACGSSQHAIEPGPGAGEGG
ncbi:MAG: hypothetical protein ACK55Z_11580 [bacterium]